MIKSHACYNNSQEKGRHFMKRFYIFYSVLAKKREQALFQEMCFYVFK